MGFLESQDINESDNVPRLISWEAPRTQSDLATWSPVRIHDLDNDDLEKKEMNAKVRDPSVV